MNHISCQDFMAEIGNYLDGDLAAEVRTRLEQHLAHCKTCTVVCDTARKTVRIVTDSDSFDLTGEALGSIAGQIVRRIKSSPADG